jgi:hypothetical protein
LFPALPLCCFPYVFASAVVWFTDVPVVVSVIVPAVACIPAVAGTVAGVLVVAGVPAVDGVPAVPYILHFCSIYRLRSCYL